MYKMVDEIQFKKYGFVKKDGSADIEESEETRGTFIKTGFPDPLRRYRLHYEGYNISIEEPYFWMLHYLKYYGGFPTITKITDVFTASEHSSFFGSSQQRLGLQQDKVSQFMATIGKMVRELFQLVRELRILDERMSYYADSLTDSPSSESAEITLKGIWVDMVEQGAKNPASVYGMSREVQFTTLPDLFFGTHPKKQEDVDTVVARERGQFNRKVKEVLMRKLRAFLAWKEHSYEEMKNRRVFTLKYLRQHFESIRMYTNWVKPYLKQIQRLQFDTSKNESADLVSAFEGSLIEVEILAQKPGAGNLKSCILINYLFRTRPEMNYTQEYQRGPIHLGRVEIDLRAYAWDDEQIQNYVKMKQTEDLQLLGLVDGSVKAALDSLGDELMRYLEEAGESMIVKEEREKEGKNPYKGLFGSFDKLFADFKSKKPKKSRVKKPSGTAIMRLSMDKKKVAGDTKGTMWQIYHHFKKQHAMLSW
tara:strand:+ start:13902 stop:15335 length:1434 start_codon:yes stop_codon:yes gene_type:complete